MASKFVGDAGWVRFGDIVSLKANKDSHPIHLIDADNNAPFWFEYKMEYGGGDWGWFSITRTRPCGKIDYMETIATKKEINGLEFIKQTKPTKSAANTIAV
jgi:hypothetical protein